MAAPNEPPLEGTHGDLLLIFEDAVEMLKKVRETDPGNTPKVIRVAAAAAISLTFWLRVQVRR